MKASICLKIALLGSAFGLGAITSALAEQFNIPAGDLNAALSAYANTTGTQLVVSADAVRGVRTKGVSGIYSVDDALSRILAGTGFVAHHKAGASVIVRDQSSSASEIVQDIQIAQGAPARTAVETVTVTSSKLGGADVQSIPISITALSQEQLTSTQTAGGPDLIKQVPNMTFTKTNFSGYSINIRGIGTQAISVTTDPAVAVALNDIPFIRNHFFEQEFYDVGQVEVLRGPQGTLYGRNATAGVVNLTSAKPTDQFEAMASGDIGNYQNRRFEGMVNIPIVDDRVDIRIAGEWTKRQGFSFNEYTNDQIDGRDLWSGRVTVGLKPTQNLQMYLVWEHFQEDDDRLRSAKQLCKTDPGPGVIDGIPKEFTTGVFNGFPPSGGDFLSQGCLPVSLYSPEAFEAPAAFSLPYVTADIALSKTNNGHSPYPSELQSSNLRVINSSINPIYKAKNDVVELNADYVLTPALTFTSQTGFNQDFLWSAEDYNRFGSAPGYFGPSTPAEGGLVSAQGVFCDPQLGCSDRLIIEDLSEERAWQLSQEFRLASNFSGPFNFSAGGNYLHYETLENYYVFSNAFTVITAASNAAHPWVPGVSDNSSTLSHGYQFNDPTVPADVPSGYIDPNPLSSLNGNGHNYFRSENPYVLNSYAAFGEVNYSIFNNLKLVGGLRWTDDQKHFLLVPSWLVSAGWGYPVVGAVDQQWSQFTGRAVANWTPKLNFTDQTLIYGSYSHGYKAGGANPPGAVFSSAVSAVGAQNVVQATHPLTFKPEFVDAFELGTKNTLLDGTLTLNGDVFFYNYTGYQISQIVDRTAINLNFDATVKGTELEASWEAAPGLKFTFSGGYEDARLNKGDQAVDLMDRTAGQPGWYVVKPFINEASNCIFPTSVAKWVFQSAPTAGANEVSFCGYAYLLGDDPLTQKPYVANPVVNNPIIVGYPGFDPSTAPNDGAGFSKDLSGNQLPNAPHFTTSFSADYTLPVSADWTATAHGDFYWQSQSYARVFNDRPYDELRGYTNVNLAVTLTNTNGWQVMGYLKNVFNTTAITGAFLNSDDSGLTTNVFLTDPRLYGVRITRNW